MNKFNLFSAQFTFINCLIAWANSKRFKSEAKRIPNVDGDDNIQQRQRNSLANFLALTVEMEANLRFLWTLDWQTSTHSFTESWEWKRNRNSILINLDMSAIMFFIAFFMKKTDRFSIRHYNRSWPTAFTYSQTVLRDTWLTIWHHHRLLA